MPPPTNLYDDERTARAYAFARPPVHPRIIERIEADLHPSARLRRALDVGCGAGLSTAPLERLVDLAVGIDPVAGMLALAPGIAPNARFVLAQAEALPFTDGAFDLITAAGSINYADLRRFLPDAARVLAPAGVMAVYDFSAGRRLRGSSALSEWYAGFASRHPSSPGYHLDVRTLPFAEHGLRLESFREIEVAVPMTLESYVAYVMSETRVTLAIAQGAAVQEIEGSCRDGLAGVLDAKPREVLFDAYVAYVGRA